MGPDANKAAEDTRWNWTMVMNDRPSGSNHVKYGYGPDNAARAIASSQRGDAVTIWFE